MNIEEIKRQVSDISWVMTEEVRIITNDIEGEFRKVIAKLDWLGQGSADDEIKNAIQDLQKATEDLNKQKSQVYDAALSLRYYASTL